MMTAKYEMLHFIGQEETMKLTEPKKTKMSTVHEKGNFQIHQTILLWEKKKKEDSHQLTC